MAFRTADAYWEGNLKEGRGRMKFGNGAFDGGFTFVSRFEQQKDREEHTSPEELIAAAHAGCFSMAFSNGLAKAGHTPRRVETTARVHVDNGKIHTVELDCRGDVPGIDEAQFQQLAEEARQNCPVSKLLTGADVKLNARLG